MDKLWAPWRIGYISKVCKGSKANLFRRILKSDNDKENYVIIRYEHAFAVLNIYPYNNGHILVLPNRSVKDTRELKPVEKQNLFELVDEVKDLLDEVLEPGGYNVGMNIGRAAGAGIPEHLHVHIVPRWDGDGLTVSKWVPVQGNMEQIGRIADKIKKKI